MTIVLHPLPTQTVRRLQAGGPDAFGQVPERAVSSGTGTPCRHCLKDVPEGAGMLILAYCPFPQPQPYAEVGPIFLCADACTAHDPAAGLPQIMTTSPDYLIKGYSDDDRIVYGTGRITPKAEIASYCAQILARPDVRYLHIRSARNNCYQLRVDAAD